MTLTKYNSAGQSQLPPSGGGGGGLTDGDYGDITVGGGGTTLSIDSAAVTAGHLGATAIALFEASGAIATHVGLADPHVQYLLVTEGDALYAPLSHVGLGGAAHANVVAAGAAGFMIGADKTKLDGVAAGATANSADVFLLDRTNHTGTQAAGTITGTKTATFISDFDAAADVRVAAGIATHEGLANPHPTYLTQAEGDSLYAVITHTHAQTDITGLVAALAGKEPTIGFTPYNATNPAGYISSITSGNVTTALGYTPTSITGLTGVQTPAAIKTGLVLVKADVGLANADNTSDVNKPVSTAQATSIGLKLDATHAGTGGTAHANVVAAGAAGFMIGSDKTKLDGVATGATANSSDATLLARGNHTGTQTAATISDFNSASRAQTEAELVAGANITITPSGSGASRILTLAANGGGGGSFAFTQVEVSLGAKALRSGSFTIAGVGMPVGKAVLIQTAVSASTGKGTRTDELELDQLVVSAVVESATVIRCRWRATGPVVGNFKFNYVIGG